MNLMVFAGGLRLPEAAPPELAGAAQRACGLLPRTHAGRPADRCTGVCARTAHHDTSEMQAGNQVSAGAGLLAADALRLLFGIVRLGRYLAHPIPRDRGPYRDYCCSMLTLSLLN